MLSTYFVCDELGKLGITMSLSYNMMRLLFCSDVLSLDMFKSDAVYQAAMDLSSPSSGLQFILCAATSPAQRAGEETLTNINRGTLLLCSCASRPGLTDIAHHLLC